MLQLRLSLSRQSNPSILTDGLFPKLARTQLPFLADEDGDDDKPDGSGIGDNSDCGMSFSSLNRSSWINGLATLLGGDPQKKGGDEATCGGACSTPQPPPYNKTNINSEKKQRMKEITFKLPTLYHKMVHKYAFVFCWNVAIDYGTWYPVEFVYILINN